MRQRRELVDSEQGVVDSEEARLDSEQGYCTPDGTVRVLEGCRQRVEFTTSSELKKEIRSEIGLLTVTEWVRSEMERSNQ